jgi:hypothetical protein
MAIKITKQGIKPEDLKYNGRCTNCKTEVECLQSDTQASNGISNGVLRYIKCPTCACTLYVNPIPGQKS